MTTSIRTSWNRIAGWLDEHAPGALADLTQGASAKEIAGIEARLGRSMPPDLAAFYALTGPAESCSIFPSNDDGDEMAFSALPLNEMVRVWQEQKELAELGEFDGLTPDSSAGVLSEWWNVGWIPFASNGGGDYYCVDMAPAHAGKAGQVITHSHESGVHKVLAPSFSEYVAALADGLEEDRFVFDETYGIRRVDEDPGEPEEGSIEADWEAGTSLWHFEKALPQALDAFRLKDYATVVRLLSPFADSLDKVVAAKLAFARKQLNSPGFAS